MKLTEELAKYLGLLVVIIVGIMVLYRMFNLQNNVIEGMASATDSKEISENIQNETSQIMDGLLIDKYRENYENTLTNLQELTNAIILRAVLHPTSKNLGGNYYSVVEKINELEKFKLALNNSMKFLDSK